MTQADQHARMLLVLGMHRSGTSAMAGALAQLGVEFGDRLLPASDDNPKGYFEHADIWRHDQDLLEALGSDWDDPAALPLHWERTPAAREAARRILEVIARDFAGVTLAGLKDPRMSRLMLLWRDLVAEAGFAPCVVLAVRSPAEVAASVSRRDGIGREHAAMVWLRHMLEAESCTRGLPRVVVPYHALIEDWRGQVARIGEVLGIDWPHPPEQVAGAIDGFIEPALRHHRKAPAQEELAEPFGNWIARAWSAFGAGPAEMEQQLDSLVADMAKADAAAQVHAELLRRFRLRIAELDQGARWYVQEHALLQEGNADLYANLERHIAKLAESDAWNAELHANLQRHAAMVAELEARNVALRCELDAATDKLDAATDDLAATAAREGALREELAQVYGSHSWRVTRPLRGAVRLTRRLLGMVPARVTPKPAVHAAETIVPAAVDDPQAAIRTAFEPTTGPRILIVTPDILGPIRNGGIGTAFHALALALAEAGHAVTILYTLGRHNEDGAGIERWEAYYAAHGIHFIPAELEKGEPRIDAPHHCWRAYRVYLWMKARQQDFDIAYFPEWKGEAYYALQAKRLGLAFDRTTIAVVTHSSTTWADSGNYALPGQFDDLVLEYLERRTTEMADVVVSPSQYMLDWMAQRGWRISAPTHVIQNLMPADAIATGEHEPAAFAVTEWVFFGRLERRKGLHVFLDALRRVPPELRQRVRVTFLGKAILTPDFDSLALIREKMADWPLPPRILTDRDRDQALEYLRGPGRVAIIASLVENSPYTVLECVLARIPFVAADVGGIAELVHPDDRARALFKPTPTGLAQMLVKLESGRYTPPRPAQPAVTTRARWLALQDELAASASAGDVQAPAADGPHITVCLVHYDRPHLLAQALDSLRQQTYRNFDVVLVDDGSPSSAAQQYLDGLSEEFAWRGWTLHRQANAYLGAARNAAVGLARGEYVLFMDDDNLAKRDELAVFASAAARSGADILTTVSDIFRDGDHVGQPPPASRELWVPLGNAAGLGVFRNVFGDANALVRRSLFERLGGFTEDYGVGHEDWEFFARATLAGADLQLVPEPLFWYRVGEASMLRAGQAQADHARSVRPYWEGLHEGVGPALAFALHLQRQPARPGGAPVDAVPGGSRLRRLARAVLTGQAHRRFFHLLRTEGVRVTAARALHYSGLRRR